MTPFMPEKLVIFDYSGVLSLEAPRFARPENLLFALAESGLAKIGVETPEAFWGGIVGPTWGEAGTTAIGYKRAMTERIEALGLAPGAAATEIAAASSRFVDLYLAHSRIDPHWRPLLETLAGDPGPHVVIATDHYAEATETIVDHLRSWNVPARKTGKGARPFFPAGNGREPLLGERRPFFIANSADIGFWKADRRFWETVKVQLAIPAIRSVLVIDDFGFNEEEGDSYREGARVEARQRETAGSLREIFQAPVIVIPFSLQAGEREGKEAGVQRILEAVDQILRFLNSGEVAEPG